MAKFDLKKAILENKATFFSSLTEGQFSWMTQDTGEQIGSQDENQIPVYMFDDKGKYYYENDYDGYGVFGGKDYYDLVAEMNGYTADNAEEFGGMFNDLRGIGIKLAFDELETKNENGDILFPALVTRPNFNWKSHDFTQEPKNDPNQSWYEPEKEDEEDEDNYDYSNDYDENNKDEYIDDNDSEYDTGVDEGKKKYYKDAEADDAKHIKALEKDMKDDKKSGKMKMSELTTKIREMVLAEMESNNMENAPENEVEPVEESDFLAELEGMLDDKNGLTDLQQYVYDFESKVSDERDEEEEQEFLDAIKQLKTPQDVYDYYAYDRGWEGSDLDNIFKQVKTKFKNLITTDDLTPFQRARYSYTKERFGNDEARKSLDIIKTFNTQEEFNAWRDKKIKDENDLNKAKRAKDEGMMNETNVQSTDPKIKAINDKIQNDPEFLGNVEDAMTKAKQGDSSDLAMLMVRFTPGRPPMFEAKKDEEEVTDDVTDGEETVDVTDDFSMEEPQGPGKIDVTQNANADLTGTKKDVQDNLEAALEAARTLGDKKLATQVGNTITFFNKQHVVKDTTVAENIKEILLLQKRAGIITETQYKQKLKEANMTAFSSYSDNFNSSNSSNSPKASFEDQWNNIPTANKEILKKSTGKEPIEIMASSKGVNFVITKGSDKKFYRYEYTQAEKPGEPAGPFITIEDAKKLK